MDVSQQLQALLLEFGPRLIGAAVTLLIGALLLRLILPAVRDGLARTGVARAAPFVVSAVSAAGWIVVLSATFQALGLSGLALALFGGTLLAVLLVAWTASGAAADVLSGLLLAQDPDFNLGARVRLHHLGNEAHPLEGTIEGVDLRKVRLRDAAGDLHVIPNRLVEGHPWTVLKQGQ